MSGSHRHFDVPLPDNTVLSLGQRAIVMGILNITPDSFSDGGDYNATEPTAERAKDMAANGVDILDVGGESTRPGADEVTAQQELDRVIPALEAIAAAKTGKIVSIDTYKAVVADQAIQSGAHIINDVYGLQREPEIADVAALYNAPVIMMHWDNGRDTGKDLIAEVKRYFNASLEIASKAGVAENAIILDPGFGFAKTVAENYELLRRMDELSEMGYPLLAGTSRKSMIGKLLDVPPKERVAGTIATNVLAYQAGAHIFRVHDVRAHVDALRVAEATLYGPPQELN